MAGRCRMPRQAILSRAREESGFPRSFRHAEEMIAAVHRKHVFERGSGVA
jgi:hypothetical protein